MIVELVGPGGTGKTTLSSKLSSRSAIDVLKVSPTKGAKALLVGIAKASRLALTHRLPVSHWLSLARNCAAVEHAMRETDQLRGAWLVDEGPVRCLRERRCNDGAEAFAWMSYARSVIARLGARREALHVIVLDLDREVREHRYGQRTQSEDAQRRKDKRLRSRLGLYLDQQLGSREAPAHLGTELDALLRESGIATVQRFICSPIELPDEMAERFSRTILSPLLDQRL